MNSIITVAIPTHNRADLLAQSLASVAAQQFPEGLRVELIIVDNNSTDNTTGVIEKFARTAPFSVRYAFERHLGSSFARNRAVDEARGDIILFLDDDAVAEPDWVAELLGEMERRRLDVACGLVVPRWTAPPPRWLGPSLFVRLGIHDEEKLAAATPAQADHIHNFFSANVGFRRETFELFGRFRDDLGVVGSNPMSGEDTELFGRIMSRGGAVGFARRARVKHIIGRERMTRAYLRRKSFAYGFGSALAGGPTHNHLDKLARNGLRMLLAAATGKTERAVFHELECANYFGYWRGRLKLNR